MTKTQVLEVRAPRPEGKAGLLEAFFRRPRLPEATWGGRKARCSGLGERLRLPRTAGIIEVWQLRRASES